MANVRGAKGRTMDLKRNRESNLRDGIHRPGAQSANSRRKVDVSPTGSYRQISIHVSDDLLRRMKHAAVDTDMNQTELILTALMAYLDDLE